MTYGDDCTRSRDIDNLESKTRDLEWSLDRKCNDLQRDIDRLSQRIDELINRINFLECEEK